MRVEESVVCPRVVLRAYVPVYTGARLGAEDTSRDRLGIVGKLAVIPVETVSSVKCVSRLRCSTGFTPAVLRLGYPYAGW